MKGNAILQLRRLCWASIFATGFGTIWFVLGLIGGDTLVGRLLSPEPPWPPREEIVVTVEGVPLIRSHSRGRAEFEYRDLQGTVREGSEDPLVVLPAGLASRGAVTPQFYFVASLLFDSAGWDHRLRPFVDDSAPDEVWYFAHNGAFDGAGYFVGYSRSRRERIGFIGVSGFDAEPLAAGDWFPVPVSLFLRGTWWGAGQRDLAGGQVQAPRSASRVPSRLVYVPSSDRIRLVDLEARTVRTLFESPEPIEGFAVNSGTAYRVAPGKFEEIDPPAGRCVLRTSKRITTLSAEGDVRGVFEIPSALERKAVVEWNELDSGQAVPVFEIPWTTAQGQSVKPVIVYRIDADGTILETRKLTLQSGMLPWNQQHTAVSFRCALPVPILLPFAETGIICFIDQVDSYGAAWRVLGQAWPSYLVLAALSLLLTLASMEFARRHGVSRRERAVWGCYVFLFGIPGFVGFWLHRRWPLRLACPQCGGKIALTQPACPACGGMLLDAKPKGTEIFV